MICQVVFHRKAAIALNRYNMIQYNYLYTFMTVPFKNALKRTLKTFYKTYPFT